MKVTYYTHIEDIDVHEKTVPLYLITEDISLEELRNLGHENLYGAVVPHIVAKDKLQDSGILQIIFDTNELIRFHILDMTKTPKVDFNKNTTLMMFSDTLNEYFEPFIEALNTSIHTQVIFGSGVGSKQFLPISPLFDKHRSYQKHSLIVEIPLNTNIGVKHGWEPIYGPLVVTKSEKNIIYELNHEPALDVYQNILLDLQSEKLDENNFFELTNAHPFGILSYTQDEFIIRDPLQITQDNALLMVSSIEENETVYIMRGQQEDLINAVRQNTRSLVSKNANDIYLTFDCISRVLYMNEDFDKELQAISAELPDSTPLFGISSIGEITNSGFNTIKIFNQTNLIGKISHVSA